MRLRGPHFAPAAVVILAAGTGFLVAATADPPGTSRPAPFVVLDDRGTAATLTATPGFVAVTSMATIRVTAPFTLLGVRPLRTDPDVEVLSARAMFWGRDGDRTASGYRLFSTNPGNGCANSPLTGHGPTYPVEGMRLQPGDNTVKLVYYTRSHVPGYHVISGHRIRYRTPDGRTGEVSGAGVVLHTYVGVEGQRAPTGHRYRAECDLRVFGIRYLDYPP